VPKLTIPEVLDTAIKQHQAGRLSQASALYYEILARDSQCADALHLLGVIEHQNGHHERAVQLIRRASILAPENPAIYSNLGEAYRHLDRLDEAIANFRKALALQPAYPDALSNLGNALSTQGRFEEALSCYQKAVAINPALPETHNNLGNLFLEREQFDQAYTCFQKALALKPDFAEAHNNLGNLFNHRGQPDEAFTCYQRSLALNPHLADTHNNLGGIFKDRGQLDEAITHHRQALALEPGRADIHSNLILAELYRCGDEPGVIAAELSRWNEQHARPLGRLVRSHANDRAPDRRLRIGYVSADFRSHPVGWFLRPLFAAHDRQSFGLFCYSNVRHPDHVTAELQTHAEGWREIAGQTDRAVAELIRQDRIDLLVDLTLHTAKNRLLVFAHQPAPVQATYLAYPGNSGLETIDYRLTDLHLDPPDQAAPPGTEQPIRLPETYWCYQPVVTPAPAVTPLPASTNGYVTFGCLNNFCKVTPATLAAWCRLLLALPTARLLLHTHPGSHRSRLQELFASNAVDPQRVRFVDFLPEAQYLQSYQSIDIGLDPFPFCGGTTTCDALWMGVPVISLAGPTPVTRGGLSLLANVGLRELVAHSIEDYVEKATALARDLPRLAALRASLRERMQRSPLMDAPRFARNVEAAYRTMWHRWCAQPAPAQ